MSNCSNSGPGSTRFTQGTLRLVNTIPNLQLVGGAIVLLPGFQAGGAITIESRPQAGTTVRVLLPRCSFDEKRCERGLDALAEAGVDPARLNPVLPVEVSVDHSLAVEDYARPDAAALARTGT